MNGRGSVFAPRFRTCLALLLPGIFLLGFTAPGEATNRSGGGDIAIELSVRGGEEGYFAPGEGITFYFETDRDCQLVIYNIDARGRVSLLHPERSDYSAEVEAYRRYRVPPQSASYELFLGGESGVEYLVAVASARTIPVRAWFPDGHLASPEAIYWEEALDERGLSEGYWVEEDPVLAMEIINERLVPQRRRDSAYGEEYLPLRVGVYADGYGQSSYRIERIEVEHHYDPFYWDPLWCDLCWSPLYLEASWHRQWYRPWHGVRARYYDPFWDPYWVEWYGPWGSGWWVSASYGVSIDWWSWPTRTYVVNYQTPSAQWGSRIKWKAYRQGITDHVSKWRGDRAVSPAPVRTTESRSTSLPATRYQLEPTTTRAPAPGGSPAVRTRTAPEVPRESERVTRTRQPQRPPPDEPRAEPRRRDNNPPPAEARDRERTRTPEVQRPEKERREPARPEPPRSPDERPRTRERQSGGEEVREDRSRGAADARSGAGSLVTRAAREVLRSSALERPSGRETPPSPQPQREARPSQGDKDKKEKRR